MSTLLRNKAIVEAILRGQSYAECAQSYQLTQTAAMTAVRNFLTALKEHTNIEIDISTSPDYLRQHTQAISDYLNAPIPTTDITPNAKSFLIHRFGKYYGGQAKDVAVLWEEVKRSFNIDREQRDINAIQCWLASEGYLVGNYVTDEMRTFAYEQIAKKILKMDVGNNLLHAKGTNADLVNTGLIIKVEFTSGDHVSERQMELKMLA